MNIDWSKLITKAMKDASAAALLMMVAKTELANRNSAAATQIARIQDRIDTLGYGIDAGEATEEDDAELSALTASSKAWKAYKFALGKVATQATWPTTPAWPTVPAISEISADPAALTPNVI